MRICLPKLFPKKTSVGDLPVQINETRQEDSSS
jgi:hypothetical protein